MTATAEAERIICGTEPGAAPVPHSPGGELVAVSTPMEMIAQAVMRGAPLDVVDKLMDLHERIERNLARKEFDIAMSMAQAEIPPIKKNREVDYQPQGKPKVNYWHEDLAEIDRTVKPILAKYGLSYRWHATSEINEPLRVTCIVAHKSGFREETTLAGPRDEGAGKNAHQALGSGLEYLKRQSVKAALGLSVEGIDHDDDDAMGTDAVPDCDKVSPEQIKELRRMAGVTGQEKGFLQFFRIDRFDDLPAQSYDHAIAEFEASAAKKGLKL